MVKRSVDKLMKLGYIQEQVMKINEDESKVLTFCYEEDGRPYELIERRLLKYLSTVFSKNSIKIYSYLYHKQKMFTQDYIFTYRELMNQLNYSQNTKSYETEIKMILDTFVKVGIIDYESFTEIVIDNEGRKYPVSKMRLTKIVHSYDELNFKKSSR